MGIFFGKIYSWNSRFCLILAPVCLAGAASNLEPSQIVDYEYVKDFENYPEKLLIDVREPGELVADGKIPFSINIPCKLGSEKVYEQTQLVAYKKSTCGCGAVRFNEVVNDFG